MALTRIHLAIVGEEGSRFFEGEVRMHKTFQLTRAQRALPLQKNDARHVVVFFCAVNYPAALSKCDPTRVSTILA